jgi:hypothetical protein
MFCILPGCSQKEWANSLCFTHSQACANQYNTIKMNPQPMCEVSEATSNHHGRWGRFVMGKGMGEPFFNQPSNICGVKKENGVWYWLIDS